MKTNDLDKCNFCKSPTKEYITIKDLPIFTGVPNSKPREDCLDFCIVFCQHCGLIQQKSSELLVEKLEKIYLSKKAVLSTPLGVGEWGRKRLENFLKDAELSQLPNEILEIGCGTGGLLFEFFKKGCKNLSCFEPSILARDIPKLDKNFSPQIYNEFFSTEVVKENKLEGKYDLIISTSVLEHIKDIKDFLLAINFALKDRGFAIVTVPNGLFHLRITDPGLMLHEHLNYFTPGTLEAILLAVGFKTFCLKIKKGLLLAKFRKKGKFSGEINQTLLSNAADENKVILRKYVENLPKIISRFKELVKTDKKEKIGLYGASVTSFNLLSLTNLKEFKNLFFIDSDSTKWHKNLFGIPIVPADELLKYQPTSILVMPPVFQEEIIEYLTSLGLPEHIKIIKFWPE